MLLDSRPDVAYGSAAISNKKFESDGDEYEEECKV